MDSRKKSLQRNPFLLFLPLRVYDPRRYLSPFFFPPSYFFFPELLFRGKASDNERTCFKLEKRPEPAALPQIKLHHLPGGIFNIIIPVSPTYSSSSIYPPSFPFALRILIPWENDGRSMRWKFLFPNEIQERFNYKHSFDTGRFLANVKRV